MRSAKVVPETPKRPVFDPKCRDLVEIIDKLRGTIQNMIEIEKQSINLYNFTNQKQITS